MGASVSICCPIISSQNKMKRIDGMPDGDEAIEASMPEASKIIMGACMPNGYVVSNDITLTLNEIAMALTRQDITMFGVYGSSNVKMGHVVERISRRVKRDNLIDLIVRASVTNRPDLKRIQGELANVMGLQLRVKSS